MSQYKVIDGLLLRDMAMAGNALLEKNREAVDALNVFPVPDGDTGTNMNMTISMAAKEIKFADDNLGVGKITKIVFLCINLPPSWPDGWSGIENEMPTPSEFKWEGTPAQTVTLSVTDYYFMISGITKIRFNIEEE